MPPSPPLNPFAETAQTDHHSAFVLACAFKVSVTTGEVHAALSMAHETGVTRENLIRNLWHRGFRGRHFKKLRELALNYLDDA